jgi:integrase
MPDFHLITGTKMINVKSLECQEKVERKTRAKRAPNGTVTVGNDDGRIYLRWTVGGKRYYLYLNFPYTPTSVKVANGIKARVEVDILTGTFDSSLQKYRPSLQPAREVTKFKVALLEIYVEWTESLNLTPRTANGHYKALGNLIKKVKPKAKDTVWFEQTGYSATVFNQFLGMLRKCLAWAVESGLVEANPYLKVNKRKGKKTKREPFAKEEAQSIIKGFQQYQPHYAPFVEALFLTGSRPSELLGLRVRDVNLEKGEMTVSSVLARSDDGSSSGKQRVRKETKTGCIKILKLNERLLELFREQMKDKGADDLLFTSVKGGVICDRSFTRRYWKPVLEKLKIRYRPPYSARHTFASLALEAGVNIKAVADMLGHSDTVMLSKVYAHLLNKPVLPQIL